MPDSVTFWGTVAGVTTALLTGLGGLRWLFFRRSTRRQLDAEGRKLDAEASLQEAATTDSVLGQALKLLDRLEKREELHAKRIDDQEEEIQRLKKEVIALHARVTELEPRAERLENENARLIAAIKDHEATIRRLEEALRGQAV